MAHPHHAPPGSRHTPRPFGRAPEHLAHLAPNLFPRESCTCDPNVYHPVCPSACDNCVQRLVALPCGRSCPDNYCVNDSSGNNKGATIGGAVGGVLGGILLAGLGFWFYRTRSRRRKLAAEHARNEARLRAAAAEKFRPGAAREATAAPAPESAPAPREQTVSIAEPTPASLEASSNHSPASYPTLPAHGPDASSVALVQTGPVPDEDVEYTELRPDGLTTYRNEEENEEESKDQVGQLNPLNKRFSTSAATHLSRISERTEMEEDAHSTRSRFTSRAPNWADLPPIPTTSPASRSVLPVPTTRSKESHDNNDPFSDKGSVEHPLSTYASANSRPASSNAERSPALLAVPSGNDRQRRLSTATTGSATSGTSGLSVNTAIPATVTRVQLQKPGKVEVVRRPSTNKSTAANDGETASENAPKPKSSTPEENQMTTPEENQMTPSASQQSLTPHVTGNELNEQSSCVSNPFEDPDGIINVVVTPQRRSGGDDGSQGGARSVRSMASNTTSMSSASFAIPLIDTSQANGGKMAHLHAADGTPLAPASASAGAGGVGLGLALGPVSEEGTSQPASHERSDSGNEPGSTYGGRKTYTVPTKSGPGSALALPRDSRRGSSTSGKTTADSVAGLSMFSFQVTPDLPQDASQAGAHYQNQDSGEPRSNSAANTPREATDDDAYIL